MDKLIESKIKKIVNSVIKENRYGNPLIEDLQYFNSDFNEMMNDIDRMIEKLESSNKQDLADELKGIMSMLNEYSNKIQTLANTAF